MAVFVGLLVIKCLCAGFKRMCRDYFAFRRQCCANVAYILRSSSWLALAMGTCCIRDEADPFDGMGGMATSYWKGREGEEREVYTT